MDTPLSKSERSIQKAFLELRQHLPVNKIKVNALCKLADINKSTFYRHYQDVYALAEDMETAMIQTFVQDITAQDPIHNGPRQFFLSFDQAINGEKNLPWKTILFQDDYGRMLTMLEEALKRYYLGTLEYDTDDYIRLSYILGGAFGVCMTLYNHGGVTDTAPVYEVLAQMAEPIWPWHTS